MIVSFRVPLVMDTFDGPLIQENSKVVSIPPLIALVDTNCKIYSYSYDISNGAKFLKENLVPK